LYCIDFYCTNNELWTQTLLKKLAEGCPKKEEAEKEEAAKSAKRGRTKPTVSPPERPPTPGGAKLGNWMRHIEATISAQASEIESLKKTVKQLRGELKTYETLAQTNVDEINNAVEFSEAKTSACVSDLRCTFDGQLQAAAEITDKKINDRVEVVRADTVRSLVNQAKKIEEIRMSFDKQIREAVKQAVENQEGARPKFKKLAAKGIFFTSSDVI